ncbi:hypothetical protein AB1Y20_005470 [Prymnesium parvum]|uniref:Uncharacterized protein n=1 Tax=Prymnesium parvum TaxID=97485 RepID=A0AB34J4S1_PRYPA
MCAGLAVMFAPPSVGLCCWGLWLAGQDVALRVLGARGAERPPHSAFSAGITIATVVATYQVQQKLLVSQFDEGGRFSLDWKRGTESLGEPLKIQTWRQFYRAAGPPVFARTAALAGSFFVAGGAVAIAHGRPSGSRD